jgi:3-oxoadipate CoA-transferase beta subunit
MIGMDKNVRIAMAQRVARDITEGSYVNLGIGLPTLVANHLPLDKDFFLHSENGVLGRWQAAAPGEEDWDMINAGKEPIELAPGGAFFHHADSFGMMRGGHLDVCVLGAFQVSATGDLANWHTGAPDAIPAVGGAMDLAIGAKRVFVMMEHLGKDGRSKLLPACTYPLTGLGCVSRVYTDLATMDITANGVKVLELIGNITPQALQDMTQVPLDFSALLLPDDSSPAQKSSTHSALAALSK